MKIHSNGPPSLLDSAQINKKSGSHIRLNNSNRLSSNVKITSDSQCATSDALELFGAELRHDGPPLADRSRTDPERPRDIRSSLKVINNVLFEHEPSLTEVHSMLQPRAKKGVLTSVYMDKFAFLKDRLADAMREEGVSRSELARACNVSAASVTKWLNGKTQQLTADNYAAAGRALGVREEWLRTGKLPRERQHGDEEREIDRMLSILEELRGPVALLAAAMAKLSALTPAKKTKKP